MTLFIYRSQLPITADEWHTITISKSGNKGKLVLDDGLPVLGTSPGPFSRITFNNHLFIGGVKDYAKQPLAIDMKTGFVGCIQKVLNMNIFDLTMLRTAMIFILLTFSQITLNAKPLVLSSPRSGVNVLNCDHVCVTQNMCLNEGICYASMESFRCQCAVGYTGKMCEEGDQHFILSIYSLSLDFHKV